MHCLLKPSSQFLNSFKKAERHTLNQRLKGWERNRKVSLTITHRPFLLPDSSYIPSRWYPFDNQLKVLFQDSRSHASIFRGRGNMWLLWIQTCTGETKISISKGIKGQHDCNINVLFRKAKIMVTNIFSNSAGKASFNGILDMLIPQTCFLFFSWYSVHYDFTAGFLSFLFSLKRILGYMAFLESHQPSWLTSNSWILDAKAAFVLKIIHFSLIGYFILKQF